MGALSLRPEASPVLLGWASVSTPSCSSLNSSTFTTMVSASHPDHLYPFQNGEYSLFDMLGADEAEYQANVRALDFHKADYKFY